MNRIGLFWALLPQVQATIPIQGQKCLFKEPKFVKICCLEPKFFFRQRNCHKVKNNHTEVKTGQRLKQAYNNNEGEIANLNSFVQ
jgi:hypothetical protein